MTESGEGSRACFVVRGAGAALINDSADELLCLALIFPLVADPVDDVDGRRGELASMSCSGIEALPSKPVKDSSSSNAREVRVLSAGNVSRSVVEAGVASAEGARSSARGLCGPRARECCGFVTILGVSLRSYS
jgi:hypothetical protein